LRNSYLGMAGGFGAVKVGRYDSPFKELAYKANLFNEELGDPRNLLSGSSAAASPYDNRQSNIVRYESPNMSGLEVWAQHTSNDGTEGIGGTGNSANSLNVHWSSGPIYLGAAYQKLGYQKTATITKQHDNAWRLVGNYSFGDVMVGAIYEDLKDIGGRDLNQKAIGLVGSIKMANNVVKLEYITADDIKGSAAAGVKDTGGTLLGIGLDHIFSKSTKMYFDYGVADNDDNTAAYSVISANAGHGEAMNAIKNGQKVKGFSGGMVLNF
jgi:predicted porin